MKEKKTDMQTKRSTLSSLLINPLGTKTPSQRLMPMIGITTIRASAKRTTAPIGTSFFQRPSENRGNCIRASADPRQIRPRGTDAFPIKVALSRRNARGGSCDGEAVGGETKRFLRVGMTDIGNEMIIERLAGDMRVVKNAMRMA